MLRVISILTMAFIVVSCDSNVAFGDVKVLPGYWDKDEIIEFTLPQMDSLKRYDLFISVRNTNDFPFNNLFLIVNMNFPHGKTISDTLEYKMARSNGEWLGEGIGSIKENKLWYKENIVFSEEGNYNITITHAVRNNGDSGGVTRLDGITDVGFSVEEVAKQQ